MLIERETWCDLLSHYVCECEEFWFCSPADHITGKYSALTEKVFRRAERRWYKYHNNAEKIPDEIILQLERFRSRVASLVQERFPGLLSETLAEEEAERAARALLANASCQYANIISAGVREEFDANNNSVTVAVNFPVTHFHVADPKFAKLLGYSVTRLLTVPFVKFIINTGTTNAIVQNIMKMQTPSHATIFYRTAMCAVVVVAWEVCPKPIGMHAVIGRGVDITREIEASKQIQTANIQKMLRQWLHSIRNASFQQQAQVIRDDIKALERSIGDSRYRESFDHVFDGLRTLIYTAKASVGLIDQALKSKGLLQYTSLYDFVNAIATFSSVFSKNEGVDDSANTFEVHYNDSLASCEQLRAIYVQGDMCSIQSIIDNIYSNAIRFTDHSLGVQTVMHIDHRRDTVHCTLQITDNAPFGMPTSVVRYFQKHISPRKVNDQRWKRHSSSVTSTDSDDILMDIDPREPSYDSTYFSGVSPSPPVSVGVSRSNSRKSCRSQESISPKSRSSDERSKDSFSHTGIPHIVELFHKLTESAEYDFDMIVTMRSNGTSYTLSFSLGVLSAAQLALDVEDETETGREMNTSEGVSHSRMNRRDSTGNEKYSILKPTAEQYILVVDDSHVIRRIVGRYLEKFEVRFHTCSDGTEALEWFKRNKNLCFGLITDLEMPRMGGDALIQQIKMMCPTLPCVVVSGNEIPASAKPIGAAACFVKPLSLSNMNDLLHELYTCAAVMASKV
eukprot:CAMPEP_0185033486 /NCGR_PEP_ID=MMETSP1103-20130426/22467_1 /TAXON_ID=36769 /ORGANISM="Paraphysomonas bandaiensis, Strain Caron Lab Isolate" /LENGTH=735 /DNA_ID=CAMNT_0027569767 /DNA_START=376 /DNA_END=2583 /DNA_ORIENTATION=+